MPRFGTVLFDLDGTVVDTVALIRESHRHAVTSVLGRDLPDDELLANVGRPLVEQMEAFDVERADHPIFCSTQGQVNHRHHDQMAFWGGGASFVAGSSVRQAVWTLGIFWVATVLATYHGAHFGQ